MRKRLLILAIVLISALGIALGSVRWKSAAQPAQPSPAPPAVPVIAGTVLSHDVPIYLRGVGTVVAYNNVVVRSQVTGQIIKIAFKQGQTVHKAALLADIDPRPPQAQLDQATPNRDQAQLVNAGPNLVRSTSPASKGCGTPVLVHTQKAQLGQ